MIRHYTQYYGFDEWKYKPTQFNHLSNYLT